MPLSDHGRLVPGLAKEVAEVARERAPSSERPFSLLGAFHGEADSLVLFLMGGPDAPERMEIFREFLTAVLDGRTFDAAATAKYFGFDSPSQLFAARDRWLLQD